MARNNEKQEKNIEKTAKKEESMIVTKESVCSTFALFSFLAFLILCTRSFVFGDLGLAVHAFLVGALGYLAYPIMLGVLYLSIMGLLGKRLVKSRLRGTYIALMVICLALIAHLSFTFSWERTGYIANCFYAGEQFPACTVGGWLGGVIVFAVSAVMSNLGTIVFFALLTIFFGYLFYISLHLQPKERAQKTIQIPEQQDTVIEEVAQSQSERKFEPLVEQRPMVRLNEENSDNISTYSPFGASEIGRSSVVGNTPVNSREWLFGGDPAENFKKNLLFDPNSNANKRTAEGMQSAYTPSYTDAYQNAVKQETEFEKPAMIFDDRSKNYSSEVYEEPTEDIPTPMSYQEEEKPVPQETLQYPVYGETPFSANEETIGFNEEETPAQKEEYKRHDYMELFSDANPRLFEENERTDNPFNRESANDRFTFREEKEETRLDALTIFDEDEEKNDPYSLRSDVD